MLFGMNMIFWQKTNADWQLIKEKCKTQVMQNNCKDTKNCINQIYKVSDLVLIADKNYKWIKKSKLSVSTEDLYEILPVYMNGNICIHRGNYNEGISICWHCLYKQRIKNNA